MEDRAANTYPDDPILALLAEAANETGSWVYIYDADGRNVFASDEVKLTYGPRATAVMPLGKYFFARDQDSKPRLRGHRRERRESGPTVEYRNGTVRAERSEMVVQPDRVITKLVGAHARSAEFLPRRALRPK